MINLDRALDQLRQDVHGNPADDHARIVEAVVDRLDSPPATSTISQRTAFIFACTAMAMAVGGLSGVVTASATTHTDDGPLSARYPLSANALVQGGR